MSKQLFLSHLNKCLQKPEPEIEVELRLGRLIEKSTNTRLVLPAHYPVILDTTNFYRFDPCIDQSLWERLKENWELSEEQHDTVKIQRGIRFIFVDDKLVKAEFKNRMRNYDIYVPGSDFDFRISISQEKEIDLNNVGFKKSLDKTIVRVRNRQSVMYDKFRIDFTIVGGRNEIEIEFLKEATAEELWDLVEKLMKRLEL
ncbi:mRNA-capping enzyme subunit beta [Dictyocoela muelleri]|nr:mRNA-capping enzyme subunit beta [Dictyocoela muelleri]